MPLLKEKEAQMRRGQRSNQVDGRREGRRRFCALIIYKPFNISLETLLYSQHAMSFLLMTTHCFFFPSLIVVYTTTNFTDCHLIISNASASRKNFQDRSLYHLIDC